MVSRIAAVHLYQLPLECVFSDEHIAQSPCAVRAEVRGRLFVIGLSDSARKAGLRPNMTQSEAKARLAELEVRPRNVPLEGERLRAAAELLMAFGPYVEVGPPNMLWVEIGRGQRELTHRLGEGRPVDEDTIAKAILSAFKKVGHRVTVAVAPDPSTARTLAQHLAQQRWGAGSKKAPPLRRRQRARGPDPRAKTRAARGPEVVVVPEHQVATVVGRLPLDALLWTDKQQDADGRLRDRMHEVASSLRLLGVTDGGRLASLPAEQVASRFGEAGALLARRAVGDDDRPLRPFTPSDTLTESFELDAVTEDLEPILFVLRRLLTRLEARLEARRLATTDVQLHFTIEPGLTEAIDPNASKPKSSRRSVTVPLRLARPTRSAKTVLAIAREQLGGRLPGAVWTVEVEAQAPSRDDGAQLDLFNTFARRVEDVGELIGRLQAALGAQAVFSPVLRDTHRPEAAWSLAAFDIERALAEPAVVKPEPAESVELEAPAFDPANRALYALPSVTDDLSVTGAASEDEQSDSLETVVKGDRPWPKPVPRQQTDEPLPPLPPRPTALFAPPERATVLKSTGLDEGVLVWRGHRHHLVALTSHECMAAEWWVCQPLERDYRVAELADGRRFWVFFDPQGEAFVHGVFD